MGVPITIINRYNSEQFEIIGEANHGSDNEYDLFKPTINGKEIFKRILIRNVNPDIERIKQFRILDLFSGAGGMSYGMEKNSHFKTEVALDFNENALKTFNGFSAADSFTGFLIDHIQELQDDTLIGMRV